MVLSRDFKEFIELLNVHKVKYLVVGAYAVAIYGYPRYTKDIDIWISSESENAQKMVLVLKDFGFSSLGLKAEDFSKKDDIIQLGFPPNRIDLIMQLEGLDFLKCYESREDIVIDGIKVRFLGFEDLKNNKKQTGRFQDMADFNNLQKGIKM